MHASRTPCPPRATTLLLLLTTAAPLAAAPAAWYDAGDPTAAEQHVLEQVNRARANPDAEADRLDIPNAASPDIREGLSAGDATALGNPATARPPLAMNRILLQIARAHSQDMWTRAFFDHVNPDGQSPSQRMTAAGYSWSKAGENIAAGSSHTPEQLENNLMIDSAVTGRGHRVNLLDCSATYPALYREVGIGYYSGAYTKLISGYNLKDFLTQDFGRPSSGGPFLVGVVHDDSLGTTPGFYDIGEGLADVRITPKTGSYFTRTGAAGGYAIPVATSGSLEVLASGSALGGVVVKTVTLGAENVKQDFRKSEAVATDGDTDGMPDAWETFFGVTDPAADGDGDGHTNLQEYQGNTDPTLATSYPGSDGGSVTPPPSGGGGGGGGGGGCFASHVGGAAPGALAALALGLLALVALRPRDESAR